MKKMKKIILLTTTLACLAVTVVPEMTSAAIVENTSPSAISRFAHLSEDLYQKQGVKGSDRIILVREGRGSGGGRGSRGGRAGRGGGGRRYSGGGAGRVGGGGRRVDGRRSGGGRRWDGRRDGRWNGRRWDGRGWDGRRRWDGRWDTRNRFDYRTRQRIAWGYPLTFFDLVALSRSGVGYGEIVYYIDSTNTELCLTDDDRDYLIINGVSPRVIRYLEARCGVVVY